MSWIPVPSNGIINSSGYYYLTADRVSSATININIQANNVFLNLNGKSIITTASNPATAVNFGIYCLDLDNIYIFNGRITGSYFGIHGSYNNYLTLEDINFDACTYIGANIGGVNNRIVGCTFKNIGGYKQEAYAIGINSGDAVGAVIQNNRFINMYRQSGVPESMVGEGVGVLLGHGTSGCQISDNIFRNDTLTDHTYGVWAVGSGHTLQHNTIKNFDHGVVVENTTVINKNIFYNKSVLTPSFAICGDSNSSTADDNLIAHFETPFTGPITTSNNEIL